MNPGGIRRPPREQLEGILPADQKGLIDCKDTIALLLQSGEEQVLFFSWAFRLQKTFRIDNRCSQEESWSADFR